MTDRHLRRWFKDFSLKQKIRTWILQEPRGSIVSDGIIMKLKWIY